MNAAFADTSFFVAFLNSTDADHPMAYELMADTGQRFMTTTWVLVELGNFLSGTVSRRTFPGFVRDLRRDGRFSILPASSSQFEQGLDFYHRRPDKRWSMVDCISFVMMKQHGLHDALTTDHHFEQAGFRSILRLPKS